MMISVPDTPFGHALGQFMLQFDRPGLDLVQAHAAFANLSAVAARDHPEMVWPLAISRSDGPSLLVTVEGMLAMKWARYADLQLVSPTTVAATLAPWTNATVRRAEADAAGQQPHLHVELKTAAGHLQWLTANCPWQVTLAGATPLHWNEALPSLGKAVAKLRRARVQHIEVQPIGALQVTFANGIQLVIGSAGWQPNAEVADLHYFMQTEDRLMMRVANQFLVRPLELGEPTIPVSIL